MKKPKLLRTALLCMVLMLTAETWGIVTTSVSYVDETYTTKTVEATVLNANITSLTPGYYVVPAGGLTFTQGISCEQTSDDPLVIIIPDGATLSIGTATTPVTGNTTALVAKNCKLGLYGQANATGKLIVNGGTKDAIYTNKSLAIAHLDVSAYSPIEVIESATGCIIAGHQTKGNTVTVKTSSSYGFNVAKSLVVNNCNLDIEASYRGINVWNSSEAGLAITGKADGSNTVKVSVSDESESSYGIMVVGPVTINNCSVGISSKGEGINSAANDLTFNNCNVEVESTNVGIGAGGPGKLTIAGRTTGTPNLIKVTSANSLGINFSGGPAEITNCDVEVNSSDNGFNGGGSPLTITGRAEGNKIKVTSSAGMGFYLDKVTTTISNCDVEVNSKGDGVGHGEYGGGAKLTITGRETTGTPTLIKVTSTNGNGINFSGKELAIANCDVEVNSVGNGFNGGGSTLTITGRAAGNKIKVVTSSGCGFQLGGVTTTISNCDVEVNSVSEGIVGGGGYGWTITGRETTGTPTLIKVTSSNGNGINFNGTNLAITNCDVEVNSKYYGFYSGGSWLTITGRETGTRNLIKVTSSESYGIGGGGAAITFSHIDVDMNGKQYGMYQSGGSISFNDANVNVSGVKTAIYNEGGYPVVITDSKLTATCTGTYTAGSSISDYCGIYAKGVTIDGSQVTATAENGYKGIYTCGVVSLSWKHADDFIYADSYGGDEYMGINAVNTFTDADTYTECFSGYINVGRDGSSNVTSTPVDGVKLVPCIIMSLARGKFMSYYSDQYNLAAIDGIQLATITGVSGMTAKATEISSANKGMPFLIYNNAINNGVFILLPTNNEVDQDVYPGFKGTATDQEFSAADMAAADHYVLRNNSFYLVRDAGTVAANRCWLETDKIGSAASRLNIVFDESTGINEANGANRANETNGTYYDLQGRKIVHGTSSNGTLSKGIYIVNGNKIIK